MEDLGKVTASFRDTVLGVMISHSGEFRGPLQEHGVWPKGKRYHQTNLELGSWLLQESAWCLR